VNFCGMDESKVAGRPLDRTAGKGRSLRRHVATLLWRNVLLKYNARWKTLYEILCPVYFVVIFMGISLGVGTKTFDRPLQTFAPKPVLPSAGLPQLPVVACVPDDESTVDFVRRALQRVQGQVGGTRVVGFSTEESLIQFHSTDAGAAQVLGAVVFPEPLNDTLSGARDASGPYDVELTFRFNESSIPAPSGVLDSAADSCRGEETNCRADGYFTAGFLSMQLALTTQLTADLLVVTGVTDGASANTLSVSASVQEMPKAEEFVRIPAVPDIQVTIFLVFGFFPMVQYLLTSIVAEKEKGRKVYLHILGVSTAAFWLSWMVVYWILITISVAIMTVLLVAGKVLPTFNGGVLFVLLFLLGLALIPQCFALSAFFNKSKTAGAVGTLVTLASSVIFLGAREAPVGVQYVLSLLPPVAVTLSTDFVLSMADQGRDVGPGSLLAAGRFSVGSGIIMLIVDIALYSVLAWYLDQVVPTEFGVRRPWYYPFMKVTHRRRTASDAPAEGDNRATGCRRPSDDEEASCAALQVEGLTKIYVRPSTPRPQGCLRRPTKAEPFAANDSITFDAADGEIVGLLGHNGAGKSTFISMLVGLTPPSSGTASVYDMNVARDIDQLRNRTGFVPQSNDIIYEDLTCKQHMRLVAGIKCVGEEWREREGSIQEYTDGLLDQVGLAREQHDKLAKNLSGGQQRKLCLAMALVGDPSLLILDEHSAGVDILARRKLWQLLQQSRTGRVTIIATHFLDEAEALCDRVIVMENGHVRCKGSPLRLKSEFNIAYSLKMRAPRTNHGRICALVQSVIPAAAVLRDRKVPYEAEEVDEAKLTLDTTLTAVGGEGESLTLQVPLDCLGRFPALFAQLEGAPGRSYEITGMTLMLPKLEHVFIKLGRLQEEDRLLRKSHDDGKMEVAAQRERSAQGAEDGAQEDSDEVRRRHSVWSHLVPLLSLQWLSRKREVEYWFLAFVMPVVLLVGGLLVSNFLGVSSTADESTSDGQAEGVLNFGDNFANLAPKLGRSSADGLATAIAFDDGTDSSWAQGLVEHYETKVLRVEGGDVGLRDFLIGRATTSEVPEEDLIVPSAVLVQGVQGDLDELRDGQFAAVEVTLVSNYTLLHEAPGVIARFSTALARLVSGKDDLTFKVRSAPFPSGSNNFDISAFVAGMLISFAVFYSRSASPLPVVADRERGRAHMIRMLGANRVSVWLSYLLLDIVSGVVLAVIAIVLVAAVRVEAFGGPALLPFSIGILLFILPSTLCMYLLSFMFEVEETANKIVLTSMSMISMLLFPAIFMVGSFAPWTATVAVNAVLLAVVPLYSFASLLYFLLRAHLGAQLGFVEGPTDMKYLFSTVAHVYPALIAMVGHTLLLSAALFYMEFEWPRRRLRRRREAWQKLKAGESVPAVGGEGHVAAAAENEDVVAEKARIQDAVDERAMTSERSSGDASEALRNRGWSIAAHRLTVAYGKLRARGGDVPKVAVEDFSLAVQRGERVGLLGPNGAGKTSFISVLTGSQGALEGSSYVDGYDVEHEQVSAFRFLGFTAQHDRVWKLLTVREHLHICGLLAGLPRTQVSVKAERIMDELSISEHADKRGGKLSGGTKRKLSLAIGTIAEPPAQVHDEPSTGMDVYAQQKMWATLRRRAKNSAVIVSTHSMSEAAALCNKIAIMTDGHLRCIGSPEHLLDKYGRGFILEVVCSAAMTKSCQHFVSALFPDARILDRFAGHIRFIVLTAQPHLDGDKSDELARNYLARAKADLASPRETSNEAQLWTGPAVGKAQLQPSFEVVFRTLLSVKEHLEIQDFAFSEPTLEQIFNTFASDGRQ